jgi:hypothetical protein
MSHRYTKEILQNGTVANDGNGDSLRDAADKINTNFTTLFDLLGDSDQVTDLFHVDSTGSIIFGDEDLNTVTFVGDVGTADRTITLPDATGTVVLQNSTDTLTNKTLTAPIISTIVDSNGDTILSLNANDSANYIEISSGDSSTGVAISVRGDSGDVDLHLNPLNSGVVRSGCRIIMGNEILTSSGPADPSVPITIINIAAASAITLADGNIVGQTKKFANRNTFTATVTPTSFLAGTSFDVRSGKGVEVMWTTAGWIHFGHDSDITA